MKERFGVLGRVAIVGLVLAAVAVTVQIADRLGGDSSQGDADGSVFVACKPAIEAQLPAGDTPDFSVLDAEHAEFSDGTLQETGTVEVGDTTYYYECQTDADRNVTDVVVTAQ